MSPTEFPDRSSDARPTDAPAPLPSRRGGGRAEPAPGALAPPPHFIDGRVVVVEADPKWPYLFQREADRIRETLGDTALAVEHVGSTAVPGMCAKPCVDVLLTVPDPAEESAYVPALEGAGYAVAHRDSEAAGRRLLRGPDVNTDVHVYGPHAAAAGLMLLFRDRLCADPADRERYQRVKLELAQRRWESVQEYTEAKSGTVAEILDRAGEPVAAPTE
ncbi:GrpB family protein [Streptomonospora salina]|uniref:GrpB-like predicted nucleotidyltransferase (UPF0157 family) n=1 Tax=Streptomonospora salina TaxID=104205 RepID=A0A841E9L8_9ACTN|nr:GrpB family protein [Streptomonospora salina]MBB5999154.1 GrpB-like predicted nucleotidyltransferase (UPF0157 family) [Streptomonospora salina]